MKKFLTPLTVLSLALIVFLSGCSERVPILPDDIAGEIKNNLGYALAPTWLPQGYEYAGPFLDNDITGRSFSTEPLVQCYGDYTSGTIEDSLIFSYPQSDTTPSSLNEIMKDLVPPKDAITELEINGNIAYFYQGGWTEETLRRVAKLEEPLNPEWDYERYTGIQFTVNVPDKGSILIYLHTVSSVDAITQKDLIKIAKSVTVIE